ncbi:M1 family aminopeptidase [Granulicella sp. L46]|uniref:M1 family aminopeptidase n=1 Tax=Granulicella sp. L46 TaxID=1641865 RepID=UPI0020B12CEA|nr:M1 family aminopeptidase [Granulicella sp. L46]
MALAFAPGTVTNARAIVPLRPQIDVTGYVIHVDLSPATGRLSATAAVTFTALEDLDAAVFGLNNALQVESVRDGVGTNLTCVRDASDSTVSVTPAIVVSKGSSATWIFTYAGVPTLATSPAHGINFAQVHGPVSALLYPGRWFPIAMPGQFTDRFTAEIHVTVPSDEIVVGSGGVPSGGHDLGGGRTQFDFNWNKPGLPGSLIVGKFLPAISAPGAANVRVYLTQENQTRGEGFATTVAQAFASMSGEFGDAETDRLDVVELPEDSVSAAWAPGVIAIKPSHSSARLLANTVAHQWWGSQVSPATLGDAWITNGMSRYAELMYVQETSGNAAFESAIADVEAGALAYDTEPLTSLGRVDPFSPQFQSMTLEKGAMVFHMLRWEMGDAVFQQFLQALVKQYADKGVSTSDLKMLAENISRLPLTAFFSQWLDGTGAPEYTDSYSVFRLGGDKGFRTVGSVSQDLDLFSMPVGLRIETEGKTVDRRVDVAGNAAQYSIETFGRPTKIIVDPDNWLLKSTPALTVRTNILLGQQALAQGDQNGAIAAYQKALAVDRGSSLANYRLAEVYMTQQNYQAAANSFRDCLRGNNDPKWTEVWSHVSLGKIYDIAGQRERAVNEYRLAIQTKDNTQGAVNEARALIEKAYKPEPLSAH